MNKLAFGVKVLRICGICLAAGLVFAVPVGAQETKTAEPIPTPTVSPAGERSSGKLTSTVPRETRAKAYAKLLEGQRHIWAARQTNSGSAQRAAVKLAKDALRESVALDPTLAEAYTALAELSLRGDDYDIDEAISLAATAVRIDPDNFGGHKFLGRLYTLKSGIGRDKFSRAFADRAIEAWKEVGRLDPRNAEAWAFLSSFYNEIGDSNARIVALRNWLSSAGTADAGFFTTIIEGSESLEPENAAVKLGEALLDANEYEEALSVLSRAVTERPENLQTVDLFGRALENAEVTSLKPAVEALRQAVYSNPDNLSLIQMLAETLGRLGDLKGAAKTIADGVERIPGKQSAGLLMALGDLYSDSDQIENALDAYRQALDARGIKSAGIVNDGDRGFALLLINKMVQTLQKSDRITDAEKVIDNSRVLFSDDDFVMDREKVSLMRATGRRLEALNLLRTLRQKAPGDYNLMRREAELLTDLGRVEEAVGLILPLIEQKPEENVRSIKYDDFVNRLFIAGLYIEAGRGEDAIAEATKAFEAASGVQSKQLATLRIAAGQQIAGDFVAAEKNLKDILQVTPNNPMALNDLGYLYLKSGREYRKALSLIQKAVRIDPRNPDYLDSLGFAYMKLGDLDKAEEILRKALRYDISSAMAYEHLGDVLREKGRAGEALTIWKKALTFVTNSEDAARLENKINK